MLLQGNHAVFSAAVVFRYKAQSAGKGHSLCEGCNTVAGYHSNALWVDVSAPMIGVAPLGKGATIPCEARLAMSTDTTTEHDMITLQEH